MRHQSEMDGVTMITRVFNSATNGGHHATVNFAENLEKKLTSGNAGTDSREMTQIRSRDFY